MIHRFFLFLATGVANMVGIGTVTWLFISQWCSNQAV